MQCVECGARHLVLGLRAAIDVLFHCVTLQLKIAESVLASSLILLLVDVLGKLCATPNARVATGICSDPLHVAHAQRVSISAM